MADLILFDLDGVLADDRHRQQLALDARWAEYFAFDTMLVDPVWTQGRELMAATLAAGHRIGYLTGRREDTRGQTTIWLKRAGFPMPAWGFGGPHLHMKPVGKKHRRLTSIYKAAKILVLQTQGERVTLYDDDPEVCRVVNDTCGAGTAIHCTWHQKPSKLVRISEI